MRDEKDKPKDEVADFKLIKQTFMGSEKALVIRVDNESNKKVTLFEQIEHIYCMCEN